jgi:hypothetical protein
MQIRSHPVNLGIYVYAVGAIVLGLLGLVSGDFATGWQHVGPQVPFRELLAYLTAIIELAAGLENPIPNIYVTLTRPIASRFVNISTGSPAFSFQVL